MRWPDNHWAYVELHGISQGNGEIVFIEPESAMSIQLRDVAVDFGSHTQRSTFSILGNQCVSGGSMPSLFENSLFTVSKTKPRNMRGVVSRSHADEPWTGPGALRARREG